VRTRNSPLLADFFRLAEGLASFGYKNGGRGLTPATHRSAGFVPGGQYKAIRLGGFRQAGGAAAPRIGRTEWIRPEKRLQILCCSVIHLFGLITISGIGLHARISYGSAKRP